MFVCYSVQEPVRGELWFAVNICSPGANWFAVANCYARFQEIFGERVRQILRSPRTLVRSGCISSRERIFWRTVRQFAAEYGRTRANPGELRRTFGVLRRTFAGVSVLANRWRIRASSRRTTVRRVYCLEYESAVSRYMRHKMRIDLGSPGFSLCNCITVIRI